MGLVKVLFTADHLPIVYLTVDELEELIRRMGLWPTTKAALIPSPAPAPAPKPASAAQATAGRPVQPVLGLDTGTPAPAAPAAGATPPAASPVAPPDTEAHHVGAHGVGVHPEGPEELAQLVSVMCEFRSAAWLAKRIGLSRSQVNRIAAGKRGASPLTMERLHEIALTSGGLNLTRNYDWGKLKAACAERAHHLPKKWRVGNGKAVAA